MIGQTYKERSKMKITKVVNNNVVQSMIVYKKYYYWGKHSDFKRRMAMIFCKMISKRLIY